MNVDNITLARPYAEAVFELAKEENTFQVWSDFLQIASLISGDETTQAFLKSPHYSKEQKQDLFFFLCREKLQKAQENFCRLLAENERLGSLSEIAMLYEMHRAEEEKILDVTLTTIAPLSEQDLAAFRRVLEKRFKRSIRITSLIDTSLIGGAKIEANDTVIDGSVRGHLEKLSKQLID